MLGTSLSLTLLAPNFQGSSSAESLHPAGSGKLFHYLDLSTSGPALLPFWSIFGYGDPSELAASHNSAFLAPLIL